MGNATPRRVCVVGSWGAGKSTLAVQIGTALNLPVVHLDALLWLPGWQATTNEVQDRILAETIVTPAWVIDGDHPRSQEARFARADLVIFLDYPWPLCLRRALSRSIRHFGRQRPGGPTGCPETPKLRVVKWILRYPSRRRPALMEKLARRESEGGAVIILKTPADTNAFVATLTAL